MEGESIQFDLTVDGGVEQRTLTDADINPMEVSVKVMLDGVEIQPEDVVGASGVLDVEYTVRNTTATTTPVTFTDVEGTEITEDVETADPFVGSLDVTLPKGFNEVTAPGATIAGQRPEPDVPGLLVRPVPAAGCDRGDGWLPGAHHRWCDAARGLRLPADRAVRQQHDRRNCGGLQGRGRGWCPDLRRRHRRSATTC